ncbi:hypothetical protein HUJ05_007623 [Dendroctonus ponderosae]|nr:hypothetical protein HUJ05_007623 [Dendroctonus ponderosae]
MIRTTISLLIWSRLAHLDQLKRVDHATSQGADGSRLLGSKTCWLTISNDQTASYCKICSTELRSHRADLEKHSKTTKHKQKIELLR